MPRRSASSFIDSFDQLTRFANDIIVLADERGVIVEANEQAEDAYGYSRREILGLPVEKLRAPELRGRMNDDLRSLAARGHLNYTAEHVRKNGERFPVEVRARYFEQDGHAFYHAIIRDVAERVDMERRLRATAERYRLLFDAAADAIVLADAETGEILDVNGKTAEVVGRPVDELRGRHHTELHPPEHREQARRNLRARVTDERLDPLTVALWHKDGYEIPVEVTASRVEVQGRPAVLGIFRDLRERLAAEDALRDSETRFRSIVESNPAGIHLYRLGADGRLVFEGANPAADRILGIEHGRLVGLTLEEAWPGLVETEVPERYREVCRGGATWSIDAFPYDNAGIHGIFDVRAFQTAPGRVAVMFLDITEQQRSREALRRSEESYRVAAEQTGQLFYDLDTATGGIDWRGAITALTGYSPAEYAAFGLAEWLSFVHPDDRAAVTSQYERCLAAAAEFRCGYRYRRKDGSYFLAEDHGVCLPSADGERRRIIGTMRDVTAARQAEEELHASETRRQKLESLALLAGGIAHDFNNLLTGIAGNISLAAHDVPAGTEARACLAEAERASVRAQELTRQLLTFSRGGAPIKKVVDLGSLLRETASFACRGTSARCEVALPADPITAEVDEGQITQVFNNISMNAVQSMPAGGVLRVSAEPIALGADNGLGLPSGQYARVRFVDTGIGIPHSLLDRVFDPYFTTKQQGSGLGLAITHSIVHRHGGAVGVKSQVGVGSEFEVILPAVRTALPGERAAEAAVTLTRGGRVLVMDDEDQVRELALRMVARLGFEGTGVPDGAGAIAAYREALDAGMRFDVVIMDLTITGGVGGKDAVRELLVIDPGARVIVSSGYSNDPIMAAHRDFGFAAVLAKPYRMAEMKETLAHVLTETRN